MDGKGVVEHALAVRLFGRRGKALIDMKGHPDPGVCLGLDARI
jgi:hypothetical protein